MKTKYARFLLYVVFGVSFIALCLIYLWEYKSLSVTDKETEDQKRVITLSHHLDMFQLAYDDVIYYDKALLVFKYPEKIQHYIDARNLFVKELDSLKQLCGHRYIPCDDILQLDSYARKNIVLADKIVALGKQGNLDSVAILLNSDEIYSLRLLLRNKYRHLATHAIVNKQIFLDKIANESVRRFIILGLLMGETFLIFIFVLLRMRIQLSDKESKRKEIEERLHIVNKAIEQSSASVVITNVKGDIEYVNTAFSKLTGYSFEEVVGQNPRVLKTGHTQLNEYTHLWDDITHNREWRGEFLNKKKNGDTYWENAIISPITNESGEITNFVAVKENITERKRLEEEQQHLLAIVENSSAYIFTFDLNWNFLYANSAMKNILEIEKADNITKYSIKQFRSTQAESITPEVEESLLSKGKWMGESIYKTLSGKLVPVIQVFILHTNDAGEPVYVSATGIDISRQKEAEKELIHLNIELRTLSKHLQHIREIEKNKIAKEIHDELGQGLASLKLDIYWIKNHLDGDRGILDNKVAEVLLSLSEKLTAFRRIYTSANTTMIQEIGLYASLEYLIDLTRQSGNYEIFFSSNIENEKIASGISLAIYRIVEESLTHSLLYAGADRVMVNLQKNDEVLILDIQNNSKNFDTSGGDTQSRFSILEIRERVYAMNGKFTIDSIAGEGVFMSIQIPLS